MESVLNAKGERETAIQSSTETVTDQKRIAWNHLKKYKPELEMERKRELPSKKCTLGVPGRGLNWC